MTIITLLLVFNTLTIFSYVGIGFVLHAIIRPAISNMAQDTELNSGIKHIKTIIALACIIEIVLVYGLMNPDLHMSVVLTLLTIQAVSFFYARKLTPFINNLRNL